MSAVCPDDQLQLTSTQTINTYFPWMSVWTCPTAWGWLGLALSELMLFCQLSVSVLVIQGCPGLSQPPPTRILLLGYASLYHPVNPAEADLTQTTLLLVITVMTDFQLSYLTYWLRAWTNIVLAPGQIPSYFTFDLDLNSPPCSASAITLHNFCVQHPQTDVTEILRSQRKQE